MWHKKKRLREGGTIYSGCIEREELGRGDVQVEEALGERTKKSIEGLTNNPRFARGGHPPQTRGGGRPNTRKGSSIFGG